MSITVDEQVVTNDERSVTSDEMSVTNDELIVTSDEIGKSFENQRVLNGNWSAGISACNEYSR